MRGELSIPSASACAQGRDTSCEPDTVLTPAAQPDPIETHQSCSYACNAGHRAQLHSGHALMPGNPQAPHIRQQRLLLATELTPGAQSDAHSVCQLVYAVLHAPA